MNPVQWTLHVTPDGLSPSISGGPGSIPILKNGFSIKLDGPVAGQSFSYVLGMICLNPQPEPPTPPEPFAMVMARLLWQPADPTKPSQEVASWEIGPVPFGDPSNREIAPLQGSITGLDLLKAQPGDTLTLELTGPTDATGRTLVQLLVGGPPGSAGDPQLMVANGPPLSLSIDPTAASITVGGTQQFSAVLRGADGAPIPGAIIRWSTRPPSGSVQAATGTVDQAGKLAATGIGQILVVASYQGMEAVADVSVLTPPTPVPGDVNGDGQVRIVDALLALRAAVGLVTLTPEELSRADINGNGAVDISDAAAILRIAVGLASPPIKA